MSDVRLHVLPTKLVHVKVVDVNDVEVVVMHSKSGWDRR